MKHRHHETPRERLLRVMSYSLPYRRNLSGPTSLVGVGLLILIVILLVVAFVGGSAAADLFRAYSAWITELSG